MRAYIVHFQPSIQFKMSMKTEYGEAEKSAILLNLE
jgi:hypothetical protein